MYRTLTLQSPVVTIRTTSLTFNSSTFCPHVNLCGSENKQHLFPHSALTGWFLEMKYRMFTVWYELNLNVMYFNPSEPSDYYMYHQV